MAKPTVYSGTSAYKRIESMPEVQVLIAESFELAGQLEDKRAEYRALIQEIYTRESDGRMA
jgi:hypothetical protein